MVFEMDHEMHNEEDKSRDAVRSKAWREREARFLRDLITASGNQPVADDKKSAMAQLKVIFAPLWSQTLVEAPAELMRHDPRSSRRERRRISSVKNNRLCRLRHALFISKVESELRDRGISSNHLSSLKGLTEL